MQSTPQLKGQLDSSSRNKEYRIRTQSQNGGMVGSVDQENDKKHSSFGKNKKHAQSGQLEPVFLPPRTPNNMTSSLKAIKFRPVDRHQRQRWQ